MRFCPHCGAPLMAGAKFCVECGRQVGDSPAQGSAQAKGSTGQQPAVKPPSTTGMQLTTAFVVVFMGITIIGLGAAAYIYMRPLPVSTKVAQAPDSSNAQGTSDQAAAQNGTAPGSQSDAPLPPGHPKIELPTEARSFIDKTEHDANDKPKDIDAWVKLGTVCMRAALFDQSYYQKASKAYAHVLKLEPENLENGHYVQVNWGEDGQAFSRLWDEKVLKVSPGVIVLRNQAKRRPPGPGGPWEDSGP